MKIKYIEFFACVPIATILFPFMLLTNSEIIKMIILILQIIALTSQIWCAVILIKFWRANND